MKRFEYEITTHSAEMFTHLVYFCTEQGECNLDQVPSDQKKVFEDLLNERGAQGWEVGQTVFGKDGVMIIWKREI
jgi:hypothetical protein